jgi:NAD(P)-dependent dehydrogenase (short-subunit alcohol dehydrogenase family)
MTNSRSSGYRSDVSGAVSKAVLVTGCSSGIGRATAERLAGRGWTVYASARRPESIKDLADTGCKLLALDVADEESRRAAIAEVEGAEGAVGALVNNAGFGLEGPVEEVPLDEWRRQFETNLFGMVHLIQLALPGMRRQRWGRIANVSSVGGRLTFPGGGPYHASKHAVEAMSDALRYEVKPFGVRVSVIEPGIIKTKFGETVVSTVTEHGGDGPYAEFSAGVAARTVGAYEGPMAMLAARPERVARVIERALRRRSPRPRYRVTAGARMILVTRVMTTDRGWDRVVRTAFPPPKPE